MDGSTNPIPLAACARRAINELRRYSSAPDLALISGAQLLIERAGIQHLRFRGRSAAGGGCRLIRCADHLLAVSLPRQSDWELVPAWLETDHGQFDGKQDSWNRLANRLRELPSKYLLERSAILGIAAARADQITAPPVSFAQVSHVSPPAAKKEPGGIRRPLVVDLSALWAGPLCSHILQIMGATVIKVESPERPDGARSGNQDFYRLLNQNKLSVSLSFNDDGDINRLNRLLHHADIVIEGSRPRALSNIGIDATEMVSATPGKVWVSITAYGRTPPHDQLVGFGDDAAAAAGLSVLMKQAIGDYAFGGDAIADPLTGIHAALAAWTSWLQGGGELIALSLRDVVSFCIHRELDEDPETLIEGCRHWSNDAHLSSRLPHHLRTAQGHVAALGEDTQLVHAQLGID